MHVLEGEKLNQLTKKCKSSKNSFCCNYNGFSLAGRFEVLMYNVSVLVPKKNIWYRRSMGKKNVVDTDRSAEKTISPCAVTGKIIPVNE